VCRRVSVTDGKTPELADVGSIHAAVHASPPNSCYVFNCQQGKGRTTVGMVLAVLYLSALVRPNATCTPPCVFIAKSLWQHVSGWSLDLGWEAGVTSVTPASLQLQDRHNENKLRINPDRQYSAVLPDISPLPSSAGAQLIAMPPVLRRRTSSPNHSALGASSPLYGSSPAAGNTLGASLHTFRSPSKPSEGGRVSSTGSSPDAWKLSGTLEPAFMGTASTRASREALPSTSTFPALAPAPAPQWVGVRRLVRSLLNGASVIPWLDATVDACSHLVNLRDVIGQYRGQQIARQRVRPAVVRLQQAFARDVVALLRYCLLLAYAAFLDRLPSDQIGTASFSSWVTSMPSVQVRTVHAET
jgi:hypothetical protein